MEGNLLQQKYYNREQLTIEEKEDICHKSSNKCVYCGKPIFAGYQMTVDHFIPLDKGGSNQFINLLPSCEDCNHDKDNKIYNIDKIKYLKPKHLEQLKGYVDSYMSIMDYCQRNRLLAYDEYNKSIKIVPPNIRHNKKTKGIEIKYTLKYASWADLNKITDYLIKYLKKNDCLDDEKSARENVIFWMQFGCIYYIEKNNEITHMFALTIKQLSKDEDYRGITNQPVIYVFTYYQTDVSKSIMMNTLYDIPELISTENDIEFMPIHIIMLEKDNLKKLLSSYYNTSIGQDVVEGFIVCKVIYTKENKIDENIYQDYDEMTDKEKKTYDFFVKFSNITNNMIQYFEKYEDRQSIGWMINSIISPYISKDSKLNKYLIYKEGDKIDG